jgi:hypothetical protein
MTAHNHRRLLPAEENTVFEGLGKSIQKIKYFPLNVGIISVEFHLITNLLSLYKIFQNAVHIRPHVHVNHLSVIFTGNFREAHQ